MEPCLTNLRTIRLASQNDSQTNSPTVSPLTLILVFSLCCFLVKPGHAQTRQFFDAVEFPTDIVEDVAVGDIDADGISDVAATGSDFVDVLLANGNGTFQPLKRFAVGEGPIAIALADFNRDGRLDAVTANFGIDDEFSNSVSVLLGNGDGTFHQSVSYVAGTNPYAISVADVNGDQIPDLVVGLSRNRGGFSVLLGSGDGTFQRTILTPASADAGSLVAADLNGDGNADVIVANTVQNTVAFYRSNGDGTFAAPRQIDAGQPTKGLRLVDLNGDSILDLVTTHYLGNSISVLLGRGGGRFGPPIITNLAGVPAGVAAADYDRDGKIDLAVNQTDPYQTTGESALLILFGNGNGTFKAPVLYGSLGDAFTGEPLATGDFNQDGAPDLVGGSDSKVRLALNRGDGSFVDRRDFAEGGYPAALATADFNKDRKLDLAAANLYSDTVTVLLGNGDGSFQSGVDFATGHMPSSVAIGDLNADRRNDLVIPNSGDTSVSVLLGNGDGTFQLRVDFTTANAPTWVTLGDFNGDGRRDIVTANDNYAGTVSVLLGNGDGTFRPHVEYSTGISPVFVLARDFNRDGKLDLAVADMRFFFDTSTISILLGNGDGTFQTNVDYSLTSHAVFLVAGDFNRDGNIDLVASGGAVLLGNGDGTFRNGTPFDHSFDNATLTAADYNGDGKLDFATTGDGFSSSAVELLLGNGDGTFTREQPFPVGYLPLGMISGDFNGDRLPDIVTGNYGDLNLSVLLNTGGGE